MGRTIVGVAAFIALAATAAYASGGTPGPRIADFALFGAGVVGLLVGRRGSKAKSRIDR